MGLRRLRLGLAMLTYQDWLLFCFVLGVLGGTAAALAFGGPVVQGCILGAAGTAGAGMGPRISWLCGSSGRLRPGPAGWPD